MIQIFSVKHGRNMLLLALTLITPLLALSGVVKSEDGTSLDSVKISFSHKDTILFTNRDGSFHLSDSISILHSNATKGIVPQVSLIHSQLKIYTPVATQISVDLFNCKGQSILSINEFVTSTYLTASLPLEATGMYIMKMCYNNRKFVQKFISNGTSVSHLKMTSLSPVQEKTTRALAIDTISLTKAGYASMQIPIMSYGDDVGTIELKKKQLEFVDSLMPYNSFYFQGDTLQLPLHVSYVGTHTDLTFATTDGTIIGDSLLQVIFTSDHAGERQITLSVEDTKDVHDSLSLSINVSHFKKLAKNDFWVFKHSDGYFSTMGKGDHLYIYTCTLQVKEVKTFGLDSTTVVFDIHTIRFKHNYHEPDIILDSIPIITKETKTVKIPHDTSNIWEELRYDNSILSERMDTFIDEMFLKKLLRVRLIHNYKFEKPTSKNYEQYEYKKTVLECNNKQFTALSMKYSSNQDHDFYYDFNECIPGVAFLEILHNSSVGEDSYSRKTTLQSFNGMLLTK